MLNFQKKIRTTILNHFIPLKFNISFSRIAVLVWLPLSISFFSCGDNAPKISVEDRQELISMIDLNSNDEFFDPFNRDIWERFTIAEIAEIDIPLTLELRDSNAYISSKADKIKKQFLSRGINMETSNIVFQTKGTNKASEGEFKEYGRILIDYEFGEPGDYYSWNEDLSFFAEVEDGLSKSLKEEITSQMPLVNIKLIEWYPLEYNRKNEKGYSYFKTSYSRQMGTNPIVKTEKYHFFNDRESITITLSYRVSESALWESDFKKVINSFDFMTKYH